MNLRSKTIYSCLFLLIASSIAIAQELSGELRKWHKITIDFEGPETNETANPNPFLDYRLDVTFEGPNNKRYIVPGYYTADGNAANSGADSGNLWRVNFSPDEIGTWTWKASFRTGAEVAVKGNRNAGNSAGFFDQTSGEFQVQETNKTGRDFRAKGRLAYVGEHYLQFQETGEYMIKQGSDSPENLLAFADFDGPFKSDGKDDGKVKKYLPHVNDWKTGDPTWKNGKGKGLIGAINYLVSEEMNAMSFITMSIKGDDENSFPYTNYTERLRMDVSKLDQWGIIFDYMQQNGIFCHFKTSETENETLLDNGNTGVQRKLYFRELIARYGHMLALNWNLGEENGSAGQVNQTTAQRKAMAQYFFDTDPYHHHLVIHNGKKPDDLLGNESQLSGFSFQGHDVEFNDIFSNVREYVNKSRNAGRKWAVACDEQGKGHTGIMDDGTSNNNYDKARKDAMWATLLAGGWGNEWYFGSRYPHSDLNLEDFRSRDRWWDYARHALHFFDKAELPLIQMKNDNSLISTQAGYCFTKPGEVYVIYLKNGGSTNLDLRGINGDFDIQWFDPRNGGDFQQGSKATVSGGAQRSVGNPPSNNAKDWLIMVSKEKTDTNELPFVQFSRPLEGTLFITPANLEVVVEASDLDGSIGMVELFLNNEFVGVKNASPYRWADDVDELKNMAEGTYELKAVATDDRGAKSQEIIRIEVKNQSSVRLTPINDAYLQGTGGTNYNTNELRIEPNNRDMYLMFDLSGLPDGTVENVSLELTVSTDGGNGTINVYETANGWDEETIDGTNKPNVINEVVGTITGTYEKVKKYTIDVSNGDFTQQELSFLLQMNSGGNDVSFASKENQTFEQPALIFEIANALSNPEFTISKEFTVFPNPSSGVFQLSEKTEWKVYSILGSMIKSGSTASIDLSSQEKGIYFLTTPFGSKKLMVK